MGPELCGIELAQSWAEAFGAVGTVAAFGVAANVYRRQQRDRKDDEASQARRIFRTINIVDTTAHDGDMNTVSASIVHFWVENRTGEPIYQLHATHALWAGKQREYDPDVQLLEEIDVLPPGGIGPIVKIGPAVLSPDDLRDVDVAIEFVDGGGRRWSRAGLDQPVRMRG